jgi:hypothetical protein
VIVLESQTPIDPTEYLYTLLGSMLGYHYKDFHWLNLVCSVPAEVSPEVSVQTTKGPPLAPCGSQECPLPYPLIPNHTNPMSLIKSAPPVGMPNYPLPHTMSSRTHVGSWLHYFHGGSLHESILRFGYDDYHMLSESTGQSLELSEITKHSSNPITPNPYSPH